MDVLADGDAGGTRQDLLRRFGDWGMSLIRRVIEATPADSIVWNRIRDRWPARMWTRYGWR